MQHKYATRGIVLERTPVREGGLLVTLLTEELGIVRARAEGLRKPGAKLAHALQSLSEAEVVLLRGKEGWRLSGAVLVRNWFNALSVSARTRAGKRAQLLLRLVQGEHADATLFPLFHEFLARLTDATDEAAEAAELVITLNILATLGHDAGIVPTEEAVQAASPEARRALIERIRHGLEASGL